MAGIFHVTVRSAEGDILDEFPIKNTLVNSGKAFIEDHALGIANWFAPGITTTEWSDMTTRYVAVGISTDTNAGVIGPTDTVGVASGGAWQGVSPDDWKLSSELARKECDTIARADGATVANIYANFGDPELGTGEVDVYEYGIFLSDTAPSNEPRYNYSERPNAMLIRAVKYTTVSGEYIATKMTRPAGATVTVTHQFGVLDA